MPPAAIVLVFVIILLLPSAVPQAAVPLPVVCEPFCANISSFAVLLPIPPLPIILASVRPNACPHSVVDILLELPDVPRSGLRVLHDALAVSLVELELSLV